MGRGLQNIFTFVKQRNLTWSWQMAIQESCNACNAIWTGSLWEWSRPWKPPTFEGNQNFISKLIQDFRSPFVYMTWKRSLYRISKDKILHKGKKAGLGTAGFRSRAVLHPFPCVCRSAHTCTCAAHLQPCSLCSCEALFFSQLLPLGNTMCRRCRKAGQSACDQAASQKEQHHWGCTVLPFPTLNGALTSKSMTL